MPKKRKWLGISKSPRFRKFGKGKKKYERNSHHILNKREANAKAKKFREANFNCRVVKDGIGFNMYHNPTTKKVMKKVKRNKRKRKK